MVTAAKTDGKRYIGLDVHGQPIGPGPFPFNTAKSAPKRHKDVGHARLHRQK